MALHVEYDREADALYFQLVEGARDCEVRRVTPQLAVDLGPNGEVVGIEVLDVSMLTGGEAPPRLVVRSLPVASS